MYLKKVWHVGSHQLLTQHFLNGQFVPDSLLLSIVRFFSQVPLGEQFGVRIERTLNMFSIKGLSQLYATYEVGQVDSLAAWLKFSSSFFFPSVVAYVVLALCIMTVVYMSIPKENRQPLSSDLWLCQFGWVCLLNVVFLAFSSYGSVTGWADITWNLPILLIIGVLVHAVYLSCKFHRNCSIVWAYVGFFQLGIILAYG